MKLFSFMFAFVLVFVLCSCKMNSAKFVDAGVQKDMSVAPSDAHECSANDLANPSKD